jgi:Ca-activated chloride channel homolog
MSAWIADFHFLRPWWLLALAALPLLWRGLSRRGTDAGAWRQAVDAHLLRHMLVDDSAGKSGYALHWLAALGWVVAVVALAGPAWERLPQPLFQNRAARVIALELAPSMAAQDVKPSRFERARYKIADLLAHNGDAQIALIAYAGDAFVVAPLTDDANTVANLVDALDPSVMPTAGNDTGRAIDLGVKLIKGAGLDQGDIILLADGVGGNAVAAASRARSGGIRIAAIGIGSAHGAPVPLPQGGFLKNANGDIVLPKLDDAALADLARAGGGHYSDVTNDARDIDHVLSAQARIKAGQASATQAMTSRYLDRGPWLLLALLPLAACAFRRGWLMLIPLTLGAHSAPAGAMSWQDLWLRPDQQARRALDAGDAARAQALARDPQLRGSAAYRAGDFAAATQAYGRAAGADAAYNDGNALARQGQFEPALAAYDKALREQPDMADALANRKAIEDWLKQQQEQKKQAQEQKQKQDSKDHQGDDQKQDSASSAGDQQDPNSDRSQNQGTQDADGSDGKSQQDAAGQDADSRQAQRENSTQKDAKNGDKPGQEQGAEPDRQAQQRYSESMNRALAKEGETSNDQQGSVRLGAADSDKSQDENQQAVQQWLQRVPDDPGGLLRRKFQLEYQRRQQGGKLPGEDGP